MNRKLLDFPLIKDNREKGLLITQAVSTRDIGFPTFYTSPISFESSVGATPN